MKNKFMPLFGLLIVCLAFSTTTLGASQQSLTTVTTNATTQPVMNNRFNMMLYTKLDSTGSTQIYMLYYNANEVTAASQQPTEVALTNSALNKSSPIWGPFINKQDDTSSWDFNYVTTSSSSSGVLELLGDDGDMASASSEVTYTCPANSSQLFYYLGEQSGSNNIYVGCITGLKTDGTASSPSLVFADAKLTGFIVLAMHSMGAFPTEDTTVSNESIFAVSEIASAGTNIFSYGTPGTSYTVGDMGTYSTPALISHAYALAFTDTSKRLHYLLHNVQYLHDSNVGNQTTDIGLPYIVYDADATYLTDVSDASSTYAWDPDAQIQLYRNPQFDPEGELIAFASAETSSGTYNQLGLISFRGTDQKTIAEISTNISRPQFTRTFSGNDRMTRSQGLFFEINEGDVGSASLAFVALESSQSGFNSVSSWCDSYYTIDGTDAGRRHMDFKVHDDSVISYQGAHQLFLMYERIDSSSNNIYALILDPMYNQVHGCNLVNTPVTTSTSYATATGSEYALTCSETNKFPKIFPKSNADLLLYHNETFALQTQTDYRDIAFLKQYSDGSGEQLVNIYDTQNASNCTVEVPACDTTYLTANPDADWDSDGLANLYDNCPCSYNPTQYDPDLDGVGEAYQASNENGCDLCPRVSNPADQDNNGDGSFNSLDSDYRQLDSDLDGMGDACEEVTLQPVIIDPPAETETRGGSYGAFGGSCSLNVMVAPTSNGWWVMALLLGVVGWVRKQSL